MTPIHKTRERILQAGVALWPRVTVTRIARQTGLTKPTVIYHIPTAELRDAVARFAVEQGCSRVIIQLVAEDHWAIADMPQDERERHFNAICEQA